MSVTSNLLPVSHSRMVFLGHRRQLSFAALMEPILCVLAPQCKTPSPFAWSPRLSTDPLSLMLFCIYTLARSANSESLPNSRISHRSLMKPVLCLRKVLLKASLWLLMVICAPERTSPAHTPSCLLHMLIKQVDIEDPPFLSHTSASILAPKHQSSCPSNLTGAS